MFKCVQIIRAKYCELRYMFLFLKKIAPHQNWRIWLIQRQNLNILVQHSWLYVLYWPSYSQFCVKIPKFSLPWQRGSIWCKCQWHHQIAWPWIPPLWCNIHGCMSYIGRVIATFVLKFPNFCCHGNGGPSDVNFNNTFKLLDLENPMFGAVFVSLSLVLAEFQPISCLKIISWLPW